MALDKDQILKRLDVVIGELGAALDDLIHNYNIVDTELIGPMQKLGQAVNNTIDVLCVIRDEGINA